MPTTTPEPSAPPPAAQVLVEVTSEGGFINPVANLGRLPEVVVDTDGHVYTPDNTVDVATAPLVQPVLVRDVGSEGAQQILNALRAAHLDVEGDDGGIVADTGVTVFTVVFDGQEIVNRITAGGPPGPGGPGHPGLSPQPSAGGSSQAALELLARLTDPSETWGAPSAPATTYVPEAYRVWAAPTADASGTAVEWPLAEPLATFGSPATPDYGVAGLRSGIVLGDDAQTFATAIAGADATSTFSSNDGTFMLWVRALLPDELG